MFFRCLIAVMAAALTVGGMTGCAAQPKPFCRLNFVAISPQPVLIGTVRMRAIQPDITIGHLGQNALQFITMDLYNVKLNQKITGIRAAAELQEGGRYRVTVHAMLANGTVLQCGTKPVSVPTSSPSTPLVQPTTPAGSA